jgi:hypothetical protein
VKKVMFLSVFLCAEAAPIHRNVCFMAAPSDYLDAADLKGVLAGGLIREDVADEIFDISDIPTPFLDMIGAGGSFDNSYAEWTEDKLATPNLGNKKVSGSDIVSTDNNANVTNAKRVGNHAQISIKTVQIADRMGALAAIGRSDEMGFQTARRLQELRRDVEAISLSGQASVQDDNNATAGQSAGAAAWITTNKDLGAGGAVPGFQTGTKLVTAQTPGEGRALAFSMVSTQIENVYNLGGNTTVLMGVPGQTKRLGAFLLTTPNSAKPTQNIDGTGKGVAQISQQFVDAFKTDFGFYMQIVPNRLQQTYADAAGGTVQTVANLFGFDPRYWKFRSLYGWKVDALGKVGLSLRKMLSVDWTLQASLERANFLIADVNPTTAVTA